MKSPATGSALDREVALSRVGGDAELLKEIAVLFLENYQAWLGELRDAAVRGDAKVVENTAHGLKGSVSNFGAQAAVEAALQLENARPQPRSDRRLHTPSPRSNPRSKLCARSSNRSEVEYDGGVPSSIECQLKSLKSPARIARIPMTPTCSTRWRRSKIRSPLVQFRHVLDDIQTLNQHARVGTYELTAISYHAYPYVADKYVLMAAGSSIGDGYGPMVVAADADGCRRSQGQTHRHPWPAHHRVSDAAPDAAGF